MAKNRHEMQLENRATILKLLRNNDDLCRKDLAEKSGLTGAAISKIVKDLIDLNLVKENRYHDLGRRNAILLELNYDEFYIIGVSFKRGLISCGIANLTGKLLEKYNFKLELDEPVQSVLEKLLTSVEEYVEKYSSRGKIVGLGLVVPGPVNLARGEITYLTNLPGWKTVSIKKIFRERFGFPVILEEVANATAFAEIWIGQATGKSNIISVLVSKGIGAGIIINGRINHGQFGYAGEIGHVSIDYNGPRCECGNRGCLELYSSTLTMIEQAAEVYGEKITEIEDVIKLFKKKREPELTTIIRNNGRYLGYAIANFINLYNPELVVINSKLSSLGDFWLDTIKESAYDRLLGDLAATPIEYSIIEDNPILKGAVAITCNYIFHNPHPEYFKTEDRERGCSDISIRR